MAENLTFLKPLRQNIATKIFHFDNGKWELESAYTESLWFQGHSVPVENLEGAFNILEQIKEHPYFFIHGTFKKGIDLNNPVNRRMKPQPLDDFSPSIEKERKIRFFCFDIDGYEDNSLFPPGRRVEWFISKELPVAFQKADYIYQISASHGLTTDKLKVHLFFWLADPIKNTQIQTWIKRFNQKKGWGKIIDSNVLTANHIVYTQTRICKGAPDPIKNSSGLVKKIGVLDFDFSITPDLHKNALEQADGKRAENALKYDIKEGIKKILLSENYHEELNRMAMALLNRKMPKKTVTEWLEGAMIAAKETLNDEERLATWEVRFKDIPRAVDSAAAIVDNPTIDELLDWISESSSKVVKADFAKKGLNLPAVDQKVFIDSLQQKLGIGVVNIKQTIREAKKRKREEETKKEKIRLKKERKKLGIHEIEITLSNTERVCEQVCEILAVSKNGSPIFKSGGALVTVGEGHPKTIRQVMKKDELGEDYPPMPLIQPYYIHSLGARIERDVVFLNNKKKEIACPPNILRIIGEGTHPAFNPLSGIIEHPFVDNKFNIVQKTGYNKQTGLYTVLHRKLKLQLINPKTAYKYLAEEVLAEFPFQTELDRATAIAAFLTCVQRPMITGDDGFPGFGIVSPIQSSGKTTLAKLISYSVYNRPMAATNFTTDDVELSKHLLAILKEGHSCVLFDNITQGTEVKSNVLAKIMSSDTYAGRILGDTKTVEVPASVIWLFTGNGIYFVGDFATRIYPINLNAKMENPESRIFKRGDIGSWAMDNRKKILSAIISIVLAGKNPKPLKTGSRFKNWDKFVRQPIFATTGIDINNTIADNKQNDARLREKIRFFLELKKIFGLNKEFTTRDVVEKAFSSFEKNLMVSSLGECLLFLLPTEQQARNSRSVGRFLSSLKHVVLGGYVLKTSFFASTMIKWRITEAEEVAENTHFKAAT